MPPKTSSKAAAKMSEGEIARVQAYLRATFGNDKIKIEPQAKAGESAEVTINGEFVATLHRDVEDDEVSYALHMVILEEDLPQQAPARR
ncbi:DUF3126 family protein [Azospirillum sp.]|uniref:DUF3126 family protein n=1 Tax=Azospirillum sp. TaxID=34012 RepID=UPI002D4B862D|nr:DUF3126 family protein [Azospirillum sp.]HYD66917.1 DUF3126 family protein [Azospirillum sp.]